MEPMNLGSPVGSPGGNQGPYLPAILMGDPQTASTPRGNTLSPKGAGRAFGLGNSPVGNPNSSMLEINRSALAPNHLFPTGINYHNNGSSSPMMRGQNYAGTPTRNTTLQTGPPTQGLFDMLQKERNQIPTASRQQQSFLGQQPITPLHQQQENRSMNVSNSSYNGSYQTGTQQFTDSYRYVPNASMRGLCSPLGANMSPIVTHTQTSPKSGNRNTSDYWVTVFGFPPNALSMILQHFTFCGTIIDKVVAPQNGNWVHLKYGSRIECDRALNINENIIGNNIMIGVTRCTDRSVIDKENDTNSNTDTASHEAPKSRLRPLVQQSFRNAQSDISVAQNKMIPQKSSGLVNKAMDLFFGW